MINLIQYECHCSKVVQEPYKPCGISLSLWHVPIMCVTKFSNRNIFFFFLVVERGGAKMNTPASLNLKILFQEHCLHMHRGNHPCGHAHVNFILFFIYFIFALWAPESNKNKLIYWYRKFWKWV